jgi:hypothetical protein
MESRNERWRKSSYSGNGGCVEVADHKGAVLIRDTKDHGRGPVHRYTGAEWRVFVADVKGVTSDR